MAVWSGTVTVCGDRGIDEADLAEAVRLWRERGHDITVGTTRCDVEVGVDAALDQRKSVRDRKYVRGRTAVEHTGGHITHATVSVLPGSGLLTLCHELGHALGYLHARSAPTGHVLHPHRPSLDDWRGLGEREEEGPVAQVSHITP